MSAASRRASGARSERSERRREGYPPEGPRPRSGLGRVAQSRSDAPSLIVCIGESVSILGTIGICTTIPDTGTGITGIVVAIGCTSTGIGTVTISTGGIGIIDTRPVRVERCAARFSTGRRA